MQSELELAEKRRSDTLWESRSSPSGRLELAEKRRSDTLEAAPEPFSVSWNWPRSAAQIHSAAAPAQTQQAGIGREAPLRYTSSPELTASSNAGIGREAPLRYTIYIVYQLFNKLELAEKRRSDTLSARCDRNCKWLELAEKRRSDTLCPVQIIHCTGFSITQLQKNQHEFRTRAIDFAALPVSLAFFHRKPPSCQIDGPSKRQSEPAQAVERQPLQSFDALLRHLRLGCNEHTPIIAAS